MIDEKKVRIMTRLALREKRLNYRISNTDGLSRKDFVSFYSVRSFFSGTIFYLIIFAIFTVMLFSIVTVQITAMNMAILLFGGILGYLFFLLFYLRYERFKNIHRYEEYQKTIREQQKDIDELTALYDAEDRDRHTKE